MSCQFDWSSLDRYNIATYVYLIAPKIINQNLNPKQFYHIISGHLKKSIPLRFSNKFDIKVTHGWVYIGGMYYSDRDQIKSKPIEISFYYKSKEDILKISSKRFWKMCLTLADTVLHEIIHMQQYRRRNYKAIHDYVSNASKRRLQEEQTYLGCPDEIDAYGFNIACELNEKFSGNRDKITEYLNTEFTSCPKKHDCWKMYLKAFEYNHNHPIIIKVKKRSLYYLNAANRGKPYKNSKWINY
jgi:hypothetical protein